MNLSEKIAQLPLHKQKEMLKKVQENGQKYRLYTLSPQQSRMWFLYHLDKEDTGYISRFRFVIDTNFEKELLDRVMGNLIERHKIMRTTYLSIEGIPFQTWNDIPCFSSKFLDGRRMSEEELDRCCLDMIYIDSEIPVKAWYVQRENEVWYVLNIHHIAHDGWSIGILLKEFYEQCEGLLSDEVRKPASMDYDYFDYIKELKERKTLIRSREKMAYWKTYLDGHLTGIPLEKKENPEHIAENVYVLPNKEIEHHIHDFAKRNKTSTYNVLLSVLLYLLEIYNDGENVNVGMPVLNRESANQLNTVGYFSNTVVIKSGVQDIKNYGDYLRRITDQMVSHLENANIPFEWIVDELNVPRLIDHNPLFNMMFSMQGKNLMKNGMGECKKIQHHSFRFSPYYSRYRTTNFALMLTVVETTDGISMGFSYAREYFTKSDMIQMRDDYVELLNLVLNGADIFREEYRSRFVQRFRKRTCSENLISEHNVTDRLETENEITELWADILGHRQFSVTQPFFNVGGNSINSFQLLKKLNDKYDASVKMAHLFEYTTIRQIAEYISSKNGNRKEDSSVQIHMF
ncbi:condensation domain-containing protein [Clostridium aminobutyricum]|uniref:Carrier domain-containing protein n=1 Tax=Clostridium aminobutyricum TaxID=33953 RepID=A0A939IGU4_CLOAM|nr:condensation domain-containing protein [Clostridium aminobutyricum]MBN7773935.1 hypothetical protein [Clostridium aminobutyricum]